MFNVLLVAIGNTVGVFNPVHHSIVDQLFKLILYRYLLCVVIVVAVRYLSNYRDLGLKNSILDFITLSLLNFEVTALIVTLTFAAQGLVIRLFLPLYIFPLSFCEHDWPSQVPISILYVCKIICLLENRHRHLVLSCLLV